MPFVPAINVAEVFIEHNFNNKPGVGWVLHYENSLGSWTAALLADLALQLVTWWDTSMQPLMTGSVHLERVRLRDITVQNGIVAEYTTGLPLTGSRAGASMPANVALSVKKNTGLAGKSFRGRVYQFGMAEGDVTVNTVETAYVTPLLAAWNEALLLIGASADYVMVLASKYSGNAPRPTALVSEVTSFSLADRTVDTRRDRL
jgi:hypothetical protein